MSRLELIDLECRFGAIYAVRDANVVVNDGEFLSILGPSGSGKTTILRLIAGFQKPTAGHILIDTTPVDNLKPEERDIGMVFQNYALFPHMTVAKNVAYGMKARKWSQSKIDQLVSESLSLVELSGFDGRYPSQLSGGQMQRVALTRALGIQPRILLMDEPLAALDKTIRDSLRVQLRQLQQKLAITTVFVTHDQVEALTMSDRIMLINEGRIEQVAAPTEMYERPATVFAARFIGLNNELPVTYNSNGHPEYRGKILPSDGARIHGDTTGQALAFIRPEALKINADNPGALVFSAEVDFISHEGSTLQVIARLENSNDKVSVVFTRNQFATSLAVGDKVTISTDPDQLQLFTTSNKAGGR